MGFDLRYPNITAQDEKGQLTQMRSYLHQLVEQLQWAFNSMDTTTVYSSVQKSGKASGAVGTVGDAERESTFNAIKSLIIKSADIVEAYYETINKKLSGLYVAQSEFGTFKEATEATLSETSTGITQAYTNIQEVDYKVGGVSSVVEGVTNTVGAVADKVDSVENNLGDISTKVDGVASDLSGVASDLSGVASDLGSVADSLKDVEDGLEEVKASVIEVNANIRTGLLYSDDNGIPIYGVEVGQRNIVDGVEVFNKYARFISNRLSFYDQNDKEVAYISDYKLYITSAEILYELKIGGYRLDTSNGLAYKWEGGNA